MKKISPKLSGIAIAIAAAGLAGCASNGGANPSSTVASTDLVQCHGVNKCKGHNDCKTADNACAGQSKCKGHGFVKTSAKACGDIGGKVGPIAGAIASADLIQCFGKNKCKGHNDCKTASNACAGRAKCKGHGFVKMPAKACGDVGGKNS